MGRNESNLVIGKHSGRNAVRNKFESLGYSLDDDQLRIVFEAVKALADRKKTLLDDDLMALVQEEVYRMPDLYRLRHVSVQSSDAGGVPPTAAVLMDVDGMEKSGAGFGVGPVDAIFNVINDMLGREPQLEQYAVNAVTGGTDALGEVTVRLREGEFSAVGRGAHPDILVATARLCERPQPPGQEGKGRRAPALPAQLGFTKGGGLCRRERALPRTMHSHGSVLRAPDKENHHASDACAKDPASPHRRRHRARRTDRPVPPVPSAGQ